MRNADIQATWKFTGSFKSGGACVYIGAQTFCEGSG